MATPNQPWFICQRERQIGIVGKGGQRARYPTNSSYEGCDSLGKRPWARRIAWRKSQVAAEKVVEIAERGSHIELR